MVAKTVELPNLKRMFMPDPGYCMFEIDLKRADAQIVAWEAHDEELKDIFRSGLDIHTENAKKLFKKKEILEWERQQCKQAVHAANYGVSAKTLAAEIKVTKAQATEFISLWFDAHPKIKNWHKRIKFQISTERKIYNAFGFRSYIFDRVNPQTFHQALAWIPQSSVAVATNIGMTNIHNNISEAQLFLQVHDSVVGQVPISSCPSIFEKLRAEMKVKVPYDDPLYIPVSLKASKDSLGDVMKEEDIPEDYWTSEDPFGASSDGLDQDLLGVHQAQ